MNHAREVTGAGRLGKAGAPRLDAFCQAPVYLVVVLMGEALAMLLSLAPGVLEDRMQRLGWTSLFIQWVALVAMGSLCLLRRPLRRLAPWTLAGTVLLVLLSSTTLVSVVAYVVLTDSGWEARVDLWGFVGHALAIALVVGLIGMQYFQVRQSGREALIRQARAEIEALQARIRPHFLFNSLNTVASLIPSRPEAAERLVEDMSDLFRAALSAPHAITLDEELTLVRRYLEIEQWRLGERLRVEWALPDPLPAFTLPALTLQPLVENAVLHGVEPSRTGGRIRVSGEALPGGGFRLRVENDLAENAGRSHRRGNHMAIGNIRARLALHFGSLARLEAAREDGRFVVNLVLDADAIARTGAGEDREEKNDAHPDRR